MQKTYRYLQPNILQLASTVFHKLKQAAVILLSLFLVTGTTVKKSPKPETWKSS